jgi:hypothetical protein
MLNICAVDLQIKSNQTNHEIQNGGVLFFFLFSSEEQSNFCQITKP